MIVRTLFVAIAVGTMCLVGCGGDGKKDGDAKKDNAGKQTNAGNEVAENPNKGNTPDPSAPVKPFVAAEWAPDPGKANPDAWRPEESKTGSSIFSALKNAVVGGGEEEPQ